MAWLWRLSRLPRLRGLPWLSRLPLRRRLRLRWLWWLRWLLHLMGWTLPPLLRASAFPTTLKVCVVMAGLDQVDPAISCSLCGPVPFVAPPLPRPEE
jgi:hypothetical protein